VFFLQDSYRKYIRIILKITLYFGLQMLDIAREIGTFWKTNKAHIWIPNIKQGFFGITQPTAKEMAEFASRR
jgi:hypothetical protein